MLTEKWEQPYNSKTLTWMRFKLSFVLIRSAIQSIRGARSTGGHAHKQALPMDLETASRPRPGTLITYQYNYHLLLCFLLLTRKKKIF